MLDILFPRFCLHCKEIAVSDFICQECYKCIEFISHDAVCDLCGLPFEIACTENTVTEHLCGSCINRKFGFTKCRSIAYYKGPLRDILHNYKYNGKTHFSGFLSLLAIRCFPPGLTEFDLVVPVPVHIKKLRKREFNQSAIISSAIGEFFGIEHDPFILKKNRDTRPQVEISKEKERVKNLKGAFSVVDKDYVKKRNVLLVDDVFTTGSTTDECSKTLLRSGAESVQVLTLMRASL